MIDARPLRLVGLAAALAALTAASATAETFQVELDGKAFTFGGQSNMDIELTINMGDSIEWIWVSGLHNVVSGFPGEPGEGELFESGDPTDIPGTTFLFTFNEAGTFGYHCEVPEDLGMVSSVTVLPEPAGGLLLCCGAALLIRRRR